MVDLQDDNIDQILKEFSSDDLIHLSDDLLNIAIDLTLQDDLDLSTIESIARSNDLLAIIPKVIASRFNKANLYSRKFASFDTEDLIFAGYTIVELRHIRKLLEDVISFIEKRSHDDLNIIFHEIFEELKDNFEVNATLYQNALKNVNDAYRIQSRHLMNRAIEVYKRVTSSSFEHILYQSVATLEDYQEHLNNGIKLLESSDIHDKYSEQLQGLRKTLILVLESLNSTIIGTGFSGKKISYIHDILYHIRHDPEAYIFEVIRRFATVSKERILLSYMSPKEIAVRYKTRYIKHNRVLLSLISNPIDVSQDFLLEVANTILKNLSIALNVKLQIIRTGKLCHQIIQAAEKSATHKRCPYTHEELRAYSDHLGALLDMLEKYTTNSDYLENLQEKCYRAAIILLEWFEDDHLPEIGDVAQRYQIYAARRLFTLRISRLCMFISSLTEYQLACIASEKNLTVCRDLIQYKYDFLKPSSIYLEAMFDLEYYREPVLAKVEKAIRTLQTAQSSQLTPGNNSPQEDANQESQLSSSSFSPQEHIQFKSFLSHLVINCLALKVQEFDDSPNLVPDDESISKDDILIRINSSRERISYFLREHEEESQIFMEKYQKTA